MSGESSMETSLDRFLRAQENDYARALAEIKCGRKRTHWMWYIFPQLDGLGTSSTTRFYAIRNASEAEEFLAHPILGARLKECMQALLELENKTAEEILGYPDVLKLRSSATLFARSAEAGSVFRRVLEKYYGGEEDSATLRLLRTIRPEHLE